VTVRITLSVVSVLRCFLQDPDRARYGYELTRAAGVPAGTLYPILDRLHKEGWLRDGWEEIDPAEAGRPARRHYRLTDCGLAQASAVVAGIHAQTEPAALRARLLRPRLAGEP
jgi:DNA-binding PadR family transcriptional regulator